jgi:hypothetical protein
MSDRSALDALELMARKVVPGVSYPGFELELAPSGHCLIGGKYFPDTR